MRYKENHSVDVQLVRHGRWILENEDYEENIYICSECGYEFIITAGDLESNELNYCPRCGAKMDGKKMDKISREQVEKVWRGEWEEERFAAAETAGGAL